MFKKSKSIIFLLCFFSLKAKPQLFSPSRFIAPPAEVYVNVSSPPSHLAPSPFNLRGVRWLLGLRGSPLEGQCETLTRVDTCPSVPGKNMVRRVR